MHKIEKVIFFSAKYVNLGNKREKGIKTLYKLRNPAQGIKGKQQLHFKTF